MIKLLDTKIGSYSCALIVIIDMVDIMVESIIIIALRKSINQPSPSDTMLCDKLYQLKTVNLVNNNVVLSN